MIENGKLTSSDDRPVIARKSAIRRIGGCRSPEMVCRVRQKGGFSFPKERLTAPILLC